MTSLTQIAVITRKAIRYSIYTIILLVIGRISFGIAVSAYQTIFPKPPPAPTVRFGRLPALPFPQKDGLPQMEYKIETTTGSLPALKNQAKVYYIPKSSPTLSSVETATLKASGLGFNTRPEEVSSTILKFTHSTLPAVLEINIVNNIFSISYNLADDPTPLSKQPPTPEAAFSKAKSFLTGATLLPKDMSQKFQHQFLKIDGQGISPALSLSDANLIRIGFQRDDIDELPAKTANVENGNVWFIISGETGNREIVAAEYHYYGLDIEQFSTYPLKTANQALEDLKAGKGYIASLGSNEDGKVTITIRRVYLAYFDPDTYTDFYQPIIVFEGDGGFVGYVPAVTSDYYGK